MITLERQIICIFIIKNLNEQSESEVMAEWVCRKCGYVAPYQKAPAIPPQICPKCGARRSFEKA